MPVAALTASPGLSACFSFDWDTPAFGESILTSSAFASSFSPAGFPSFIVLPVADTSVFAASGAGWASTTDGSGCLPASTVVISGDLISALMASDGLVSAGLSSDDAVSAGFAATGSPSDDAASVIVTAGWVAGMPPLASAVCVRSRKDVGAGGSPMKGLAPSAWPTLDLSSSFAGEIAGLIGV